jgi:hypothetical protein
MPGNSDIEGLLWQPPRPAAALQRKTESADGSFRCGRETRKAELELKNWNGNFVRIATVSTWQTQCPLPQLGNPNKTTPK